MHVVHNCTKNETTIITNNSKIIIFQKIITDY